MANNIAEDNRKAAHKLDIAFIIIGAAIILGFGTLFGRGVAEHLKYLTAGTATITIPAAAAPNMIIL